MQVMARRGKRIQETGAPDSQRLPTLLIPMAGREEPLEVTRRLSLIFSGFGRFLTCSACVSGLWS